MEKVQPINTGLQIPNSKMPLDYVKYIPAPASSWPHAEPTDMNLDIRENNMNILPKRQQPTSRQE